MHVEGDYLAAVCNGFCFSIRQTFKSSDGGNVTAHTNAKEAQTAVIDGRREL